MMSGGGHILRIVAVVALAASACATAAPPKRAGSPNAHPVDPAAQAKTQKLIVAALDDIALGRGEVDKHLTVPFMIGPALWGWMVSLDPALEKIGTESLSVVPMPGGPAQWKMRSFMADSVPTIARHIKFRAVAEAWRAGTVRAATPEERSLFYALTPMEIDGEPLTILTTSGNNLVVYVQEGRLMWIDAISEYKTTPNAAR
jgi:hypothetical protein